MHGCCRGEHLLQASGLEHEPTARVEIGELCRYERPLPELQHYDALLCSKSAEQ